MKLYISGPMTGYVDFNRPAFERAAASLRAAGHECIVPGDGETYTADEQLRWRASDENRATWLHRDFNHILGSADAVVVLSGWVYSEGARAEVLVAQNAGIRVLDMNLNPIEEIVLTWVTTKEEQVRVW